MSALAKRQRVSQIQLVDTPPDFDSYTEEAAEKALIGAVMNAPSVFPSLAEMVTGADFSLIMHGWIWWACDQLTQENKRIDLFTVADLIAHRETSINAVDIQTRLVECMGASPDSRAAAVYAERVLEAATRIRLLKAAQDIKTAALDKTKRQTDLINESDAHLDAALNRIAMPATDAASITTRYFERVEDAITNGVKVGTSFGFPALDERTGGLMPGGVTVLAAPAGAGKTTVVLSIIRQLMTLKKRVALYSLEMTNEQIIRSLIAMEGSLDRINLMQFKFSKSDWTEFVRCCGIVSNYPLNVVDHYTSLSPEQLRLNLRKLAAVAPLDAVVIDGLWLMQPATSTKERRLDVKEIVEKLVGVARDFNTPILLVHQLNRAPSDRSDKRPMLSDLSESISVSQTAELVFGLYRPTYYDPKHIDGNTYLNVLKARHIPNAHNLSFVLEFDARRGAYTGARNV